jgi:hypothetical protein
LEKQTQNFQPQALVIALGVDALASDPHVEHDVSPKAFSQLAERIKISVLPRLFRRASMFPLNWALKSACPMVFRDRFIVNIETFFSRGLLLFV